MFVEPCLRNHVLCETGADDYDSLIEALFFFQSVTFQTDDIWIGVCPMGISPAIIGSSFGSLLDL
jgi:hypothetical protein